MQLPKEAYYKYLPMDPQYITVRTSQIQMGWEMLIEQNLNRQFRYIEDLECQSGSRSVPTRNGTLTHTAEPLLTLILL
jgi:hypothetical protein